jgi:hypothetical protein
VFRRLEPALAVIDRPPAGSDFAIWKGKIDLDALRVVFDSGEIKGRPKGMEPFHPDRHRSAEFTQRSTRPTAYDFLQD